jgi:hypothetical protein
MSESITRRQFVQDLSKDEGSININDLSPELAERLKGANVSAADLQRIAGPDAQISGANEFGALFDRLDRVDDDHSSRSLKISTGGDDAPTLAGAAKEALDREVADRRLAAHSQGVVHLGMRPESEAEVRALERVTPKSKGGVTSIRGYASDGITSATPGGPSFDLRTDAGQKDFRDALVAPPLNIPAARADALMTEMRGVRETSRDEFAQLALALHHIGTGELPANRLVISGHGMGDRVFGDAGESLTYESIRKLGTIFPEAAAKIQHLDLANCFSAGEAELDKYRAAFPNLKSVWAYNGFSPKAEHGATKHLEDWARKTDGDDPSRVDPRGSNAATWNNVDGRQGFSQLDVFEAEAAITRTQAVWDDYKTGKKTLKAGEHDPALDRFYERIQDALALSALPAERRIELTALRDEVLKVRHPELVP